MSQGKDGGVRTSRVEEHSFRSVVCLLSHNTLIGSETPVPRWWDEWGGSSCFDYAQVGGRRSNEHD